MPEVQLLLRFEFKGAAVTPSIKNETRDPIAVGGYTDDSQLLLW